MRETHPCGSEQLTREELELRAELLDWIRKKLNLGKRPVAIQAALIIAAKVVG